jgi:Icc protein
MQRILCSENISCENHVVHQQWLVMLLDTTLNNSNAGHLSESECQRLDIVMRQYPDKHVLLAMHHPPLPMAMAWLDNGVTLDNPERVQQLVTRHPRIRGVIWGHAHREYFEMCNDVVWAGCPSTMAQFRPGVDVFELDNAMPGFRYLDLADDGSIASAVIRVPQLAAE